MIPLKDNLPTRRFPVVCIALIAANVAVFLADRLTGHVEAALVPVAPGLYQRVPQFVGGLSANWAMVPGDVTHDLATAWPTVFSAMFLHANWLHIGGNMLYLWIFGNNIEDTLGRPRFVLFYLLCGVGAAAAQIYTDPSSTIPTIGASGAVAGVMGAYILLFPRADVLTIVPVFFIGMFMELPALIVIGYWVLIQFLNANWLGGGELLRGGGVAYFAHVGGFVSGLVLILLMGGRGLAQRRRGPLEPDWR